MYVQCSVEIKINWTAHEPLVIPNQVHILDSTNTIARSTLECTLAKLKHGSVATNEVPVWCRQRTIRHLLSYLLCTQIASDL